MAVHSQLFLAASPLAPPHAVGIQCPLGRPPRCSQHCEAHFFRRRKPGTGRLGVAFGPTLVGSVHSVRTTHVIVCLNPPGPPLPGSPKPWVANATLVLHVQRPGLTWRSRGDLVPAWSFAIRESGDRTSIGGRSRLRLRLMAQNGTSWVTRS